ncbi:NnrS family protein [Aureimonas glaciei]|uniref:Short-chain dehydrogenase n=1 Tax=Aureimonas glaciei TaxID=1776957 RepID=A0A917DG17_9HYPH|nr:NnrS family protein [Aureimonas glaciei]GGD37363.1 short-chain dehydrogenase [Aureimonas glaciei]
MQNEPRITQLPESPPRRISRAIPRGLAITGPILFSYGFRPFFLAGGSWAVIAMLLWIAALAFGWPIGGDYGAAAWHAHEMLFGFTPAVLAGFLLTAVPNWTGRLPVSGPPLMVLVAIWAIGRLAMLSPALIGVTAAAVVDALFLPSLLFICAREVVAGRKWSDLKVITGLAALSLANILFHHAVIGQDHSGAFNRLGISAYVMLITIIGGRIIPSFTRNWMKKFGHKTFPVPHNRFDEIAIAAGLVALGAWVVRPEHPATAVLATTAGLLHAIRLYRWRGWRTWPEKLLLILHLAYAFVALGLFGIALGTLGVIDEFSVLHLLSVGAVASMMIAVMSRVSRGHTGRVLTASLMTAASYAAILLAAVLRLLANVLPDFYGPLIVAAGLSWILAFSLFCWECGPMLVNVRRVAHGDGASS